MNTHRMVWEGIAAVAACAGPLLLPAAQEGTRVDPPVSASELRPLERSRPVFEFTEGEREGERIALEITPLEGSGGVWELALGDVRRTYVREERGGGLVIVREDLPEEGYRVDYQPPVRLLPARLGADTAIESRSRAIVYDLETGERIGTGEVDHRVETIGTTTLNTPAGTYDAFLVKLVQDIDMDLADLHIEIVNGYAPGIGRVYQRSETRTEKIGLFSDTTMQAMRVVELDEGAGGPTVRGR